MKYIYFVGVSHFALGWSNAIHVKSGRANVSTTERCDKSVHSLNISSL